MKALGFVVSKIFSYIKFMGADDLQGEAIFDPRGMIGRIYVGYL